MSRQNPAVFRYSVRQDPSAEGTAATAAALRDDRSLRYRPGVYCSALVPDT